MTAQLITAVEEVNNAQKLVNSSKNSRTFWRKLNGKTFGFGAWPLNQVQMICEKHQLLYTIKELVKRGAKVKAYDPKAMDEAKTFYLKELKEFNILSQNTKYLKTQKH